MNFDYFMLIISGVPCPFCVPGAVLSTITARVVVVLVQVEWGIICIITLLVCNVLSLNIFSA